MRQIRSWVWLVVALSALPIRGLREAAAGKCPRVAVLLDKSGSMAADPDGQSPPAMGQVSKWVTATNTIRAKILTPYHLKLPLGFGMFPGAAMCMQEPLKVPMDYGKKADIEMAMAAVAPGGGTPMCIAVKAVAGDTGFKDPERANFMILVTDGAPNECCEPDAVGQTEKAIQDAAKQTPPVYTFVIGFGKVMAERDALNRLAVAGGVSARNYGQTQDFYQAENPVGLEKALDQVMDIITGGDAGGGKFCDDSCYHNACTGKDQVCIDGACKVNPCTGYSCPMGTYCFTDGGAPSCATPCAMSCPSGKSCNPGTGTCDADPCSGRCGDREMCSMGTCVPDPMCMGTSCKLGQQCRRGVCIEEPCRYVACPSGYQCEPYSGACTPLVKLAPLAPPRTMPRTTQPLPPVPSGDQVQGGWCATANPGAGSRSAEVALWGLSVAIGLLLLRRRTRGAV